MRNDENGLILSYSWVSWAETSRTVTKMLWCFLRHFCFTGTLSLYVKIQAKKSYPTPETLCFAYFSPFLGMLLRKPIGATWDNNLMHKLYGGRHIILFGGRHIIKLCGGRQIKLYGGRHMIHLSGGRPIKLCGCRHTIFTLNYYLMWHRSASVCFGDLNAVYISIIIKKIKDTLYKIEN